MKRVLLLLTISVPLAASAADAPAEVKVAHRHLVARCLDGSSLKGKARDWRLPAGDHSLAFTMRNEPRRGVAAGEPGFASVTFPVEAGHRYEVEVRAPATAYAARVWKRGDWKPVVRDRTTDRIVSGDPTWNDGACAP